MKEKLLALCEKLKYVAMKVYSAAPFACGLAIGYWGHPLIQVVVNLALDTLKWALK